MNRDEQRQIFQRILSYSDTISEADTEDILETLEGTPAQEFAGAVYVLDMDMDDNERAQICQKYKDNLDTLEDSFVDTHMTTWDFLENVTGSDDLSVPGMVPTLPNDIGTTSYSFYVTTEEYAQEHGVHESDIRI